MKMEDDGTQQDTTRTQVGQILWATIITSLWIISVVLAMAMLDGDYLLFYVGGALLVGMIWFNVITNFDQLAPPSQGRAIREQVSRALTHPGKTEAFLTAIHVFIVMVILLFS
jgi:hypothetical protein